MKYLIYVVVMTLFGTLGWYLDAKRNLDIPPMYYIIGAFAGSIGTLILIGGYK